MFSVVLAIFGLLRSKSDCPESSTFPKNTAQKSTIFFQVDRAVTAKQTAENRPWGDPSISSTFRFKLFYLRRSRPLVPFEVSILAHLFLQCLARVASPAERLMIRCIPKLWRSWLGSSNVVHMLCRPVTMNAERPLL